ncbi:hypothetical protein [Paracoccus aminovorans]|uniref:hypothetical protein n=1 Tax=Paracoccus aminovorans TaxID=34004 RepID=UPI002B25ADAF|nr:hypothetical protein [Paracoccus aminovorans]
MAIPWAGIGAVLGGLGGLFGKKPKQPTPRQNLLSQAQGAREAAEKYGFNPLTMLQYGQPGGALGGGGGAPPLASIEMLTGGLAALDDELSGDADRRRAAERLEYDIAKLKLDQARSGVIAAGPGASPLGHGVTMHRRNVADTIGSGVSPLGRNNATYGQTTIRPVKSPFTAENPIAPGRNKDVAPLTNSPGAFEIQNTITGGPITIPGEGEPWGIDELATAVVVGLPQVAYNKVKDRYFNGDYWKDRTILPKSWTEKSRVFPEPGWMEKAYGKGHY